jgi:hypothetical protein
MRRSGIRLRSKELIDLLAMKGVRVDPVTRVARLQPGVLLGEFDHETQAFGLAVPAGIVTHTGVAGLTLGGGIGWLMRKHGLTIDSLIGADVVTADGSLVRASGDENPDLFWGIRDGGGNFGVVTSFEFRAHPVGPMVYGGPILWPMEDGIEVLRFYRDFIAEVPNELTCIVNVRRAPAWPIIPQELHGRLIVQIGTCYAGPHADGERVLEPLRRSGAPLLDLLGPKPFTALQASGDAAVPHGWNYYWRSADFAQLDDELIETIIANALKVPNARSYALLFQLGGTIRAARQDEAPDPAL